jgi:Sulfotransferase domain
VIFVAGFGRSGTTLLERALGELPAVQPLGEVIHLWRRSLVDDELCGCGVAFSRCEFWRAVGAVAFGGWENVDVSAIEAARRGADRLRSIPTLVRRWRPGSTLRSAQVLAEYHRRLYAAAAHVSGADVVVDSSKHSSLPYSLRTDPALDLRVVHVIRDSRGVAYSWTKSVERPEAASGGERWMTRYSPRRAALLWSAHNASVAVLRRSGTPVMAVRYESFVEQPRRVIAAVARFAALDVDEDATSFVHGAELELAPAHTASGNPLRFRSGRIRLTQDDAWHEQLPPADQRLVTALTYPQLRAYGYSRRGSRPRA